MSVVGTICSIAQGEMRAKPDMKPWVHTDKNRMSSAGVALTARAFALRLESTAPLGLIARPHQSIPQTQYNQIQKRNNSFTHPKTFYEHNTTTQHRKRPIRQIALKGRHSCKAQGEMRAKPDMKPWENSKQQN